jgi:hypothetical protein
MFYDTEIQIGRATGGFVHLRVFSKSDKVSGA